MQRELNATTKKKWSTPQLIVLVRGRPEEGVLFGCKGDGSGGASGAATNCAEKVGNPESGEYCMDCSNIDSS